MKVLILLVALALRARRLITAKLTVRMVANESR